MAQPKIKNCLTDNYEKEIARDVIHGLTAEEKFIPSKYFYDDRGSKLFEDICKLPEYYLTRTEISILKEFSSDLSESLDEGDIIELGSGAEWKIRMLLDACDKGKMSLIRYVPVDVSESAMIEASEMLMGYFPDLKINGIVADFTKQLDVLKNGRPKFIILFGSTIGNFDKNSSNDFFREVASIMNTDDTFLVGVDLIKSIDVIEAAYNDSEGITAAFNKNILNVINNKLGANFNPAYFDHHAFFNKEEERVEMHLKANRNIEVEIPSINLYVEIEKDETIKTEICRKFSRESLNQIIEKTGLEIRNWYTDPEEMFALAELSLKK